ncbi:MAG TPA: NUDIX domain-containing protein [Stellaceae bacterium]|nr:NUDIX domain-containing protein [Stellaceae bacterium]
MAKRSAGLLLYRVKEREIEVFLVHPGGPFWAKKDEGAWTIPKGEIDAGEDALAAAIREFAEETGATLAGEFRALPPIRQAGGKTVLAWAIAGELDAAAIRSNEFEIEWPPKSGQRQRFPEIDRAEWFALDEARRKINKAQAALLDALVEMLRQRR